MADAEMEVNEGEKYPPVPAYFRSYGVEGTGVPLPEAVSLEPPAIPAGKYRSFGFLIDPDEKDLPLKEQGREELFERPKDGGRIDSKKVRACDF